MTSPIVTLTQQELLSLSPEVRQKVRKAVTPKRNVQDLRDTKSMKMVMIEEEPNEDADPLLFSEPIVSVGLKDIRPTGIVVPDPYEVYLHMVPPGQNTNVLKVVSDSHALHMIYVLVNNQKYIEGI